MKAASHLYQWAGHRLTLLGRARLWAELRTMDSGSLSRAGFASDLLEQGPGAWPWRAESPEGGSKADTLIEPISIDGRGAPVPTNAGGQFGQSGEGEPLDHPDSGFQGKAA